MLCDCSAISDNDINGLFEGLGNLNINENAPVTAATAGPDWGEAQIMSMEGEEAGRMRFASVPPGASAAELDGEE